MLFAATATVDNSEVYRLIRSVRKALRRGDPAEAEQHCRSLLALEPTHEAALDFLAIRALESGDAAHARAITEQGLVATPDSALLHFHRGCALEATAEHGLARDAFDQAFGNDSQLLEALFRRGGQENVLGLHETMLQTYIQALSLAQKNGLLDSGQQLPDTYRTGISRAIDTVQDAREEVLDRVLSPLRARHGPAALARIQRALDVYLGKAAIEWPHPLQRPTFLLIPDLPPQPWFDREDFPFLILMENAVAGIREEMLAVLEDEAQLSPYVNMAEDAPAAPVWRELNRSLRWSSYHLFRHGRRIDAHCQRCPKTVAALESLPIMRIPEHSPEALFSVLKPRTHIPPHAGVINGRLTVHLPLVVPENCGALKAGGEARVWEQGRCLVFDDSMVHEAWNHSGQTRVVLIFDIWNPYLSEAEREAMSAAVAAIGRFNRRYGSANNSVESG